MARSKSTRANKAAGFLSRLRRDARGNTLAIVAAAMIPLIAMVGGGVDVSRMYLAKVRLQHACDAGALAGRKAMGAGTWAQTNPNPNTTANQFFDGNFRTGAYGTKNLNRTYSENKGDVTGTASVVVPMTMMKFFGMPDRTMSVTCDAQMQIPNTDVMFVLDTTGSMGDAPDGSNCHNGSGCKIAILKNAVKCFYESVAQYDISNATCDTTPTNNGVSGSQIRFGFVPYSMNVNISDLQLPNSYFADNWQYQSREKSWTAWANTSPPQSCSSVPSNTNTTQYQTQGTGVNCKVQKRTAQWWYHQYSLPISGLKGSTTLNSSLTLPIGNNFTNATISWPGCVEEAHTVAQSSYSPIPANANDLNIDLIPTQSDANTLWAPALPTAVYLRQDSSGNPTLTDQYGTTNFGTGSSTICPTRAKKLDTWSAGDFQTYVDSLAPNGNTYHDIGMIWGGRLLSPNGIFGASNKKAANGGDIQRHMIFMTDGDAVAVPCNYTAYGVAWYDRRTTTDVGSASACGNEYQALDDQVNSRLSALCTEVKNEPNTTLWVISFGGTGIAATTKTRLTNCATDANHYFDATDKDSLDKAFELIAAQITQLRLTK